ncbi:juvenile hormone epoxide hydrolase 1-like [Cimex lectularius]|uniref:Epoxide hydrolase n=1 Tax=Cimex lectularius TaxID=79782 RepID=A0A8I6S8X7_CIMLE|nr:juvenile hormone epoxide hydrolase 1-like [Cimex lectularius]
MGCCLKMFGLVTLVSAVLLGLGWHWLTTVPDVPNIKTEYWGPGTPKPDDKSIRPFIINVSDEVINDLKDRLAKTKLTKPLEGVGFQYGFNTGYLAKILDFWRTKYDWKEREVYLNKYPQFKTQIGGLQIHFLHVKPDPKKAKGKQTIPLLMLHGWPGSVREFYEIIPMLTTPKPEHDFVFEVVAPSLPGYGFSDGASKPGLGPVHMAALFNDLMVRIGHQKYYIQGGDWGSIIGVSLAVIRPNNVLGYHSNMCFVNSALAKLQTLVAYFFPSLLIEKHMQADYPNTFFNLILESGYMHIQATKPDTVGVALSNSPAGLAAYILEKFSTWTNKAWRDLSDGGLEHYDKAALLDNVMIYWITNSITSSVRLYSEAFSKNYQALRMDEIPMLRPTGCARFKNELVFSSASMLTHHLKDLVQITDYADGGHFAAFEVPDVLAADIWKFVKTVRLRKSAV